MTYDSDSSPKSLDEAGRVVEAINAYECAFVNRQLTRESIIDLAFLYAQCWDFGFASTYDVPSPLVRRIGDSFPQFINEAREQFGEWDDLRVVEVYLPWVFLGIGESADVETELESIVRRGKSLLPVLYLWFQHPTAFSDERSQLLSQVSGETTSKAQFIRSILRG